jgi:hypothetical protein
VDYWQKVNDGTSVRYTRFIPSYRPKTSFPAPDSLVGASGPGVNTGPERIAFVDRNHPQPGIRGRHWDNKVYLLMESDFATGIQEAINRGLQPK